MVAGNEIGPRLPSGVFHASSTGNPSIDTDQSLLKKGPSQQAPEKHGLFPVWKGQQGIGAGLQNMGNTCYLNSVLQCLAYLPPLGNLLLRASNLHGAICRKPAGTCSCCLLQAQLLRQLQASRDQSVRPWQLVQNLHLFSKSFLKGRQEDSHEFLHAVLDAVERDSRKAILANGGSKAQRTLIEDLFQGRTLSQVRCSRCHTVSDTYEHFTTLSLDIVRCSSVAESLQQFTTAEVLDGANRYRCDKCKQLVAARKQLAIDDEPNILAIHLKRFDAAAFGAKITKHIKFAEKLDLTPFGSSALIQHPGSFTGSVTGSITATPPKAHYFLTGVLVHQGSSIHSGHYYAYVRDSSGHWFCANDSVVSAVGLQQVLNAHAYLLFYVRTVMKAPAPLPPATAAAVPPAALATAKHAAAQPVPLIGPQLPPGKRQHVEADAALNGHGASADDADIWSEAATLNGGATAAAANGNGVNNGHHHVRDVHDAATSQAAGDAENGSGGRPFFKWAAAAGPGSSTKMTSLTSTVTNLASHGSRARMTASLPAKGAVAAVGAAAAVATSQSVSAPLSAAMPAGMLDTEHSKPGSNGQQHSQQQQQQPPPSALAAIPPTHHRTRPALHTPATSRHPTGSSTPLSNGQPASSSLHAAVDASAVAAGSGRPPGRKRTLEELQEDLRAELLAKPSWHSTLADVKELLTAQIRAPAYKQLVRESIEGLKQLGVQWEDVRSGDRAARDPKGPLGHLRKQVPQVALLTACSQLKAGLATALDMDQA